MSGLRPMIFLVVTVLAMMTTALRQAAAMDVALVIGNASYGRTAPLATLANDANDMAAALSRLGFTVLVGRDLDKAAMEQKIRDFTQQLAGARVGLFFYAGHALQLGGSNFLMPVDARLETESAIDQELVRLDVVVSAMEAATKTNILLLDASRDNPMVRKLARVLDARAAAIGRGLLPINAGPGTIIGSSAQPGIAAPDGYGRNSPYVTALLKHIETPGLEVPLMLIKVRRSVIADTFGRQVPWDRSPPGERLLLGKGVSVLTQSLPAKATMRPTAAVQESDSAPKPATVVPPDPPPAEPPATAAGPAKDRATFLEPKGEGAGGADRAPWLPPTREAADAFCKRQGFDRTIAYLARPADPRVVGARKNNVGKHCRGDGCRILTRIDCASASYQQALSPRPADATEQRANFLAPRLDGFPLSIISPGKPTSKAVADAFCVVHGYGSSATHLTAASDGRKMPVRRLEGGELCGAAKCGTITRIDCVK